MAAGSNGQKGLYFHKDYPSARHVIQKFHLKIILSKKIILSIMIIEVKPRGEKESWQSEL